MRDFGKKAAPFLLTAAITLFVPMQVFAGNATSAGTQSGEISGQVQTVNAPAEDTIVELADTAEGSGRTEETAKPEEAGNVTEESEETGETENVTEEPEDPEVTANVTDKSEKTEESENAAENQEEAGKTEPAFSMSEAKISQGTDGITDTSEEAASDVSAHMHASITTNLDTYESGTTAIVSVNSTHM